MDSTDLNFYYFWAQKFKFSLLANYRTLSVIIHYCTFGVVLKNLWTSVMHRFITGHFYKMNNRASEWPEIIPLKITEYWEFIFFSWETVWNCGTVQKRNLPISGSGISLSNFLLSSKCTLNTSRILTMPFIPSTPLMPKMPNLQLSWMIFTWVALKTRAQIFF